MGLSELYSDYNIPTAPEGHKHHRTGWINASCPVCSKGEATGYHLGFNVTGSYFTCYHCGGLQTTKVISLLINISYAQASELVQRYDLKNSSIRSGTEIQTIGLKPFELPSGVRELTKKQKAYLESRGFDPDWLEREFGILGTGPLSKLGNTIYKYRILIPIYWNGSMVSFQTRDYTNKQVLRYVTCAKEYERIHHKQILYCKSNKPAEKGIIVEGVFDVWRFREFGYSTFGIGYTPDQLRAIKRTLKEVYVIYDPDKNAQMRAANMVADLLFAGINATNIVLKTDPGDMSQAKADRLLQKLGFI